MMKSFSDAGGESWTASVIEENGADYKGRWVLTFRRERAEESPALSLRDVRWNSRSTAERTLATMSDIELRRRLRVALGRA